MTEEISTPSEEKEEEKEEEDSFTEKETQETQPRTALDTAEDPAQSGSNWIDRAQPWKDLLKAEMCGDYDGIKKLNNKKDTKEDGQTNINTQN